MLRRHHTVSFLGPFASPTQAMATITWQMAIDHLHPTEVVSRAARPVTVFHIAGRHWIDVGVADKVIVRVLLADPGLRAYRCVLEFDSGNGHEMHAFQAEFCRLVADAGRSVPVEVETKAFEHHLHHHPRLEDAWVCAVGQMAEREYIVLGAHAGLDPLEQRHFDVRDAGVRPRVARARRALVDAADYTCERAGTSWELRMTMVDGSRRMLVLDDADQAELDPRR